MDKLMKAASSPLVSGNKPDEKVLQFIREFRLSQGYENEEIIRSQFRAGYCYAFALILNDAYGGGTICWAAPFGHVVYVIDGIPYDIEGVYEGEGFEYFIPMSEAGRLVYDFKHRIDTESGLSWEDRLQIILDYCSRTGIDYNPKVEEWL